MSLTGLAFLALFAFGLFAAFVKRPIYGLYTYVAVFYLHPPSRWWGAGLPDLRWSMLAALVTLIAVHVSSEPRRQIAGKPWYSSTIAKGLIIYTCWMWIQAPWVMSDTHMDGVVLFTKYILLFYLIVKIVDNESDFANFCLAHVIGCAFLGWLVYVSPDTGRLESVGGPGIDNANTLGMHLATGLFFAGFLLLAFKDWRRWVVLASIPLILNAIIQTETRGAIVGIALGGLATVYLKPKRYRRQYYFFAILGFVGLLYVANDSFLSRMETMRAATDTESEWDNSAASRIVIAEAQLEMFKDYPLGVGHQGTAFLSRGYMDERWMARQTGDRASHNTILSVLVDQGLPGILIFSFLGLSVLRRLRRAKKLERRGLPDNLGLYRAMLGGTVFVIYGAGMFAQYLKAEIQIWTFALLAIFFAMCREFELGKTANVPRGVRQISGEQEQYPASQHSDA